ncbi:hypothetical protein QQG74_09340 [Micromonospora sp. FIMYZ51]|uniref:hypothetical protein n=1 Tax=Micromonospora sp. FIMYZ51 TaxID=3051832 RepID=UPI00311E67C3
MPTLTPTDVTVIRSYEVVDAEPVDNQHSSVRIIPTKVTVTFVNGVAVRVVIEGPNAKKDGTAGVNRHEESYYLTWADYAARLPEWVSPLLVFTPV